jgi:uncharacterized protein YvpB
MLPTVPLPSPSTLRATPKRAPTDSALQRTISDTHYTAYVQSVVKPGHTYPYSCEFDAAWVILQSYGLDVTVDELIRQLPHDTSREPRIVQRDTHVDIIGGDILTMYSGDYTKNFLARTTGQAFAQVFNAYGLDTQPVHDADTLRVALLANHLVWLRATVDFKDGVPAIWTTPDGTQIPTVLGNDHTVVVIGYNERIVVIRDPLGPTSSNQHRQFEYEVPWQRFLAVWEQQNFDALAVERPQSLLEKDR